MSDAVPHGLPVELLGVDAEFVLSLFVYVRFAEPDTDNSPAFAANVTS